MNRNKKKRPGTGGVIVVKWKSSSGFRMGKGCLKVAELHHSAAHFEGKNSWNGEFCFVFFKTCNSKVAFLKSVICAPLGTILITLPGGRDF